MGQLEEHISCKVGFHVLAMREHILEKRKEHTKERERLTREIEKLKNEHKEEIQDLRAKMEKYTEEIRTLRTKCTKEVERLTEEAKIFQTENLLSFLHLDNKEMQSDIRFLKGNNLMLRNYANFLREEHFFDGEKISDRSWVYENDHCDVFVWLIRDFSEKRKSNKMQRSRKFPIGQAGYHAQVDVYPGGDDDGTHLSIYLCLQPGPFDSSLPWPFNRLYKVSLLNLENVMNSSIKCLSADSLNDENCAYCFRRPRFYDNNDGFGFPKHTELDDVEKIPGFLINDTIIVKVAVKKWHVKLHMLKDWYYQP